MSDKYTPQDLQDNLAYLNETKDLIKQAIIDKEQPISENDTFRSYADKIRAIETGIKTDDATATEADIIAPKTAYVNDQKIVGTIIPEYVHTDCNYNGNAYIVNETGYLTIDISPKYNLALLAPAMPLSNSDQNIYLAKIVNNKFVLTGVTFNVYDFISNTGNRNISDICIAKALSSDGYLNIFALIANTSTATANILAVRLDINETKIKDYFVSNDFSAGKNINTSIEINPINPNLAVLTTGTLFLAELTSDSVVCSSMGISISSSAYIRWNESGTRFYAKYFNNNQLTYTPSAVVCSFSLTSKSARHIYTYASREGVSFYGTDYFVVGNSVYNLNNPSVVFKTLSITSGTSYFTDIVMFSSGDYIYTRNKLHKLDKNFNATLVATFNFSEGSSSHTLLIPFTYGDVSYIIGTNSTNVYYLNISSTQKLISLETIGAKLLNTDDATATSADLLEGEIAYSLNNKILGTMPNIGTRYITPGDSTITIPKGYHSGSGYVRAVNITSLNDYKICDAIADSILEGTAQYIPLEYIQVNGTQYINTGVGASATSIKVKANVLYTGKYERQDPFLWSCFDGSSTGLGDLYADSDYSKFTYFYGSGSTRTTIPFSWNTNYEIESTLTSNSIVSKINDYNITISTSAAANGHNITLFRRGNTDTYVFCGKVYYLQIYVDGVLVRDYIPAKDFSGNVGLYDKVSAEFFYNNGTGTFTAGPVIEEV